MTYRFFVGVTSRLVRHFGWLGCTEPQRKLPAALALSCNTIGTDAAWSVCNLKNNHLWLYDMTIMWKCTSPGLRCKKETAAATTDFLLAAPWRSTRCPSLSPAGVSRFQIWAAWITQKDAEMCPSRMVVGWYFPQVFNFFLHWPLGFAMNVDVY